MGANPSLAQPPPRVSHLTRQQWVPPLPTPKNLSSPPGFLGGAGTDYPRIHPEGLGPRRCKDPARGNRARDPGEEAPRRAAPLPSPSRPLPSLGPHGLHHPDGTDRQVTRGPATQTAAHDSGISGTAWDAAPPPRGTGAPPGLTRSGLQCPHLSTGRLAAPGMELRARPGGSRADHGPQGC